MKTIPNLAIFGLLLLLAVPRYSDAIVTCADHHDDFPLCQTPPWYSSYCGTTGCMYPDAAPARCAPVGSIHYMVNDTCKMGWENLDVERCIQRLPRVYCQIYIPRCTVDNNVATLLCFSSCVNGHREAGMSLNASNNECGYFASIGRVAPDGDETCEDIPSFGDDYCARGLPSDDDGDERSSASSGSAKSSDFSDDPSTSSTLLMTFGTVIEIFMAFFVVLAA